jgi:hypothetical protein
MIGSMDEQPERGPGFVWFKAVLNALTFLGVTWAVFVGLAGLIYKGDKPSLSVFLVPPLFAIPAGILAARLINRLVR